MATTRSDKIYSGTLTTSSVSLGTIAVNTTFILQGFWISNGNTAAKKAELLMDGKRMLPYVSPIPNGETILKSGLNMPMLTGTQIALKGEVASDMDYYIWGVNEVVS